MANGNKVMGFHRPHARVQEDGAVFNHVTGELSYPPSMAKQEFAAECDINNILKHFSTTGMLNHVSARAAQGVYQDLPDAVDFQESLHLVRAAETAFMTLPSKLRDRFNNEPAEFLAFCSDPANLPEMRELGLTQPLPPQPAPQAPGEPSGREAPPSTPPPTGGK